MNKHADKSIIVFDWDDTLFPTTFLNIINYHIDDNVKQILEDCESHVISILDYFVNSFYHIYIVSNAEKAWISYCIKNYYNRLYSHELFKKINIISARDMYIDIYTIEFNDSMYMWKYQAMYDIMINIIKENDIKQIISFGDSEYEREAILSLASIFPDIYGKSIKFISAPTCIQLIKQSIYIEKIIDFILDHKGPLDINIEKEINENMDYDILNNKLNTILVDRHNTADISADMCICVHV